MLQAVVSTAAVGTILLAAALILVRRRGGTGASLWRQLLLGGIVGLGPPLVLLISDTDLIPDEWEWPLVWLFIAASSVMVVGAFYWFVRRGEPGP